MLININDKFKIWRKESGFFLHLFLGCLLYLMCGHSIIGLVYNIGIIEFLNNHLTDFCLKSVEHYCRLADFLFFVTFSIVFFLFMVFRLIFSSKKVSLFWVLFLALFVIAGTYSINLHLPVYTSHSFYRVGIANQIMNGFVPPTDSLFAGHIVHCPWGYPFLLACISEVFNISPFLAAEIVNLIAILVVMWLIYLISNLLIKNHRSNVLSALVAVFGVCFFSPQILLPWLGRRRVVLGIPVYTEILCR